MVIFMDAVFLQGTDNVNKQKLNYGFLEIRQ